MELFTAATLAALSGRQVTDESCAAIHTWVLAVIEGEIGPLAVAAVALELGRAAVPTPGGAASTTIGPYSATYADSGPRHHPELTREQRNRLRRAAGRGGAFQISTVPTIPAAPEEPDL